MTVASTLPAAVGRKNALQAKFRERLGVASTLDLRRLGLCACCCATSPARLALSYPNPSRRRSRRVNLNSRRRRLPDSRASSPRSCPSAATSRSPRLAQRPRDDQQGHRGPALRAGSVVAAAASPLAYWRETLATRRLDAEYMLSIKGYQSALVGDNPTRPLAMGASPSASARSREPPREDFLRTRARVRPRTPPHARAAGPRYAKGLGPYPSAPGSSCARRSGISTRASGPANSPACPRSNR